MKLIVSRFNKLISLYRVIMSVVGVYDQCAWVVCRGVDHNILSSLQVAISPFSSVFWRREIGFVVGIPFIGGH